MLFCRSLTWPVLPLRASGMASLRVARSADEIARLAAGRQGRWAGAGPAVTVAVLAACAGAPGRRGARQGGQLLRSGPGKRNVIRGGRKGLGCRPFPRALPADFSGSLFLGLAPNAPGRGGFRPPTEIAGHQEGQNDDGSDACQVRSVSGHSIDDPPARRPIPAGT